MENKVCGLIIDGGCCTNIAITALAENLGLRTIRHPKPYKPRWLDDRGEVKVNKKFLVNFSIGQYKDEILCDDVPMHAGHILLGRPWQYDRKVKHDGFRNRYSFDMNGKTITLVPLKPQQVHDDQVKLKGDGGKMKKQQKMSLYAKKSWLGGGSEWVKANISLSNLYNSLLQDHKT